MTGGNPNQQFILRCFMKPDGHMAVDFLLPPGLTINDVMPVLKADGWFWGNGQQCVCADSVMWMTLLPQAPGAVLSDVTINKPHLSVVPCKKPEPPEAS